MTPKRHEELIDPLPNPQPGSFADSEFLTDAEGEEMLREFLKNEDWAVDQFESIK